MSTKKTSLLVENLKKNRWHQKKMHEQACPVIGTEIIANVTSYMAIYNKFQNPISTALVQQQLFKFLWSGWQETQWRRIIDANERRWNGKKVNKSQQQLFGDAVSQGKWKKSRLNAVDVQLDKDAVTSQRTLRDPCTRTIKLTCITASILQLCFIWDPTALSQKLTALSQRPQIRFYRVFLKTQSHGAYIYCAHA